MAQMDALALEAAEEVFGHGVVIGIALAAVSYTHLDVYKRQRHARRHPEDASQ